VKSFSEEALERRVWRAHSQPKYAIAGTLSGGGRADLNGRHGGALLPCSPGAVS
jgi:hypothetical protein